MVFKLPSLPSLPSLKSLLDSEPQVLYPPSATNTPAPSPSKVARKVLPPVPDDWAHEREARGRRNSTASASASRLVAPAAGAGGVRRPGHRRAHSALPPGAGGGKGSATASASVPSMHINAPLPLGRLTEFSRNPHASTSALSLPTLLELEMEDGEGPNGARLQRRDSRASITSSISDMSSLPPSPRRPGHGHGHGQMMSLPNPGNVPPPISSSGHRGRTARPAAPPRFRSAMDVRVTPNPTGGSGAGSEGGRRSRAGLTRHLSYSTPVTPGPGGPRPRPQISERRQSSSQISDVAVLASWSFPATPPPACRANLPTQASTSTSTSNLAERLRSLAMLDTRTRVQDQPSSLGLTINDQSGREAGIEVDFEVEIEPLAPLPALVPRFGHPLGGVQQRPRLSHRYTHSSPNLGCLAAGGGASLNARGRGLRQPIPLGSGTHHHHHHQHSTSTTNSGGHGNVNGNGFSSSPGSILSLSVSDTSSSSIGPPSPATSLQDLPPVQVQVRGQEEEPRSKWSICDPRKWSTGSSRNIAQVGVESEYEGREGMTKHKHLDPEESEEEEQYLEYGDF